MTQRIFDGHNDALYRLQRRDKTGATFLSGSDGHVDLPRARRGGLAGGVFATFVLEEPAADAARGTVEARTQGLGRERALQETLAQLAIALRMARASGGEVRICHSAAETVAAMEAGTFAMRLHMEGAEAVGPDLDELEPLYAAGVRSLGIVWSRPTIFGHGVPFRFPSLPDIGPGLTERGIALVKACNQLGIMVDCSHLTEKGFWDVVRVSEAPIVATHSNAHVLCPASRNLTDAQMDAIRDSGGVVGLNFGTTFLRQDARRAPDTPLEVMIRHLDRMLEKLGPRGVALGSDFDGAVVPNAIGDVAGLPALVGAMEQAGYGAEIIDGICWRNWLGVIARTERVASA